MAQRYKFYFRFAVPLSHSFVELNRDISLLPQEHKIHILEPRCNVFFIIIIIIWRPDEVDIADFDFIAFEKSSQFYKLPFVFIENTNNPFLGYRSTN